MPKPNHGTSTFTGHSGSSARFWPAGEMSPDRFWPAGMTKQEWHTLQHMQQTQTPKRKQHDTRVGSRIDSEARVGQTQHIENGDGQQGSNNNGDGQQVVAAGNELHMKASVYNAGGVKRATTSRISPRASPAASVCIAEGVNRATTSRTSPTASPETSVYFSDFMKNVSAAELAETSKGDSPKSKHVQNLGSNSNGDGQHVT